jgi:hypothetical protein
MTSTFSINHTHHKYKNLSHTLPSNSEPHLDHLSKKLLLPSIKTECLQYQLTIEQDTFEERQPLLS